MSRRIFTVLVASLTLVGCDLGNKEASQYDDARNPYYKQAQQDLDNNNPSAAVADYESALGANPKLAGAHYQLGVLYGDKLNDPVGSIFHFKRFLELAPTSDKADQVKAWIDKQSQVFAASMPNSPAQSADDYAKLQAENASLKKQVEDATHTITQLQTQLTKSGKHHADAAAAAATAAVTPVTAPTDAPSAAAMVSNAAPATPVTPETPTASSIVDAATATATNTASAVTAAVTNAAPSGPQRALPVDLSNPNAGGPTTPAATASSAATGESRSYKITSGDSLWKIAHKMYPGDTKNGIDKIKEANKDTLIEGKPLKIGQVLIIPE